ncbi:hypothetical protein H9L39_18366 [Fusarium oxysporum f. sp. albedinis]|nr:hypothetical protein H9L39_18366 [Fusarium oxysporum f. sp. albedinis]
MESRALTKSPNLARQQLAYPAIAVGADDRESLSVTDHDMPTHGKPSQDESNIVLEFQSRVMSAFISDPAAWLRRERWHLKMDNSTTQPRGIKLDSNASHRTAPPDSVTESQVSSEDLTIENVDENIVSPATIKSRPEHYQLLDSSQEPERDADYLALDHAGLSSTLLCQEFGFREDLPLEQLAYTDSQQRFCPNHPGQAQMEGCFKVVNTKWLHRTNGDKRSRT